MMFAPSRKTQNATITMLFIVVAMLITGAMGLPEAFATNALYVIAAVGGVAVGGQALVDKEAAKK